MNLAGRLRATSVGDLLGTLHRARATGSLELIEDRGRSHRIHVLQGRVVAVELDGAGPSLGDVLKSQGIAGDDVLRRSLLRSLASRRRHGEVLVDEFRIAPSVVSEALRRQLLQRLALLEQISDARIAFRVAVRQPRGALSDRPLEPKDFLHGRRRARPRSEASPAVRDGNDGPWQILGLAPGTDLTEIKRAYRRLVRSVHPDVHPNASEDQRRVLEARFAEITEAYRSLVA
jgi:DnaJ-domain-containing protein 1